MQSLYNSCFRTALLLCLGALLVIPVRGNGQRKKDPRPPGVVIDYSPASTKKYIGSPALCILKNGTYIAAHDFFGPGAAERKMGRTVVFESSSKGKSWRKISELEGQFWSGFFEYRDTLYLLGTDREYGNVVIRRSVDGGRHWTIPADERSGLLFAGRYHTAPVPVVMHKGYLWRSVEQLDPQQHSWGKMFMSCMLSAPLGSDLLDAAVWRKTNCLPYDSTYLGGTFAAWLEGNAVIDPRGGILNVLRVSTAVAGSERAALIRVDATGKQAAFNKDFVAFPGGSKKFCIRYDSITGLYWTLANVIDAAQATVKETGKIRNTLALCTSADLRNWEVKKYILHHPDMDHVGFQYADWQFDGKDIVFVSRTAFPDAFGGAHRQHDANYFTFHRIKKFRKYKKKHNQ